MRGFIASLLAGALVTPVAGAADHPPAFRVGLQGTTTATWDYTTPDVASGDCTTSDSVTGTLTVRFRSARTTVVRARDASLVRTQLRALGGTSVIFGSTTRTETCAGEEHVTHFDCVRTSRSFSATATLSARAGRLVLSRLQGRVLASPLCPRVPPGGELGGVLGLGSRAVSLPHLVRAVRARVPGGYDQGADLSGDVVGGVTWQVRWTLTFVRVHP